MALQSSSVSSASLSELPHFVAAAVAVAETHPQPNMMSGVHSSIYSGHDGFCTKDSSLAIGTGVSQEPGLASSNSFDFLSMFDITHDNSTHGISNNNHNGTSSLFSDFVDVGSAGDSINTDFDFSFL